MKDREHPAHPCPSCEAKPEEVTEYDYGPTGASHYICGACGYTYAIEEGGQTFPISD